MIIPIPEFHINVDIDLCHKYKYLRVMIVNDTEFTKNHKEKAIGSADAT